MPVRRGLKFIRSFLAGGIIGPIVTIALTTLDTFISPWFTWTGNALSDLGVHPYYFLFNYSLIFEACMNFIFVVALLDIYRIRRITAGCLAASGTSLGLVGIFVETYHPYHLIFALIYFILFPISIIAFSRETHNSSRAQSTIGYVVATLSLITIVTGVLISFNAIPGVSIGLAIPEMVEASLLGGWSVYIGVRTMYFRSSRPEDTKAPT